MIKKMNPREMNPRTRMFAERTANDNCDPICKNWCKPVEGKPPPPPEETMWANNWFPG
jgi:hypothetical protein